MAVLFWSMTVRMIHILMEDHILVMMIILAISCRAMNWIRSLRNLTAIFII